MKAIGLVATLAALALTPSDALAQRGRGGYVNTPFGQASMSDMRASGGDPFAAMELRQERLMLQQQQQMMRMQQQSNQQMARQKKAREEYLKKHPEAAKALAAPSRSTARTKKNKTNPTRTPSTAPRDSAKPAQSK